MRTIARAFFAAALLVASTCADPGVTTPTSPATPLGTPQSLALTATPTAIPYAGAMVRVVAAITVEAGGRVPGSLSVQLPGSSAASLIPLRTDGTLDQQFWITTGGDLVARAGTLERRVTITRQPAPPPPEPPSPTCTDGSSWPCPQPTPTKQPEPTPSPSYTVTVTGPPSASAALNTPVTFTVSAEPVNNASKNIWAYQWDWTSDGTFETTTTVPSAANTFTKAGIVTVKVIVTGSDGSTGTGSMQIAVTNGLTR
jgi:hypothetical protein